MKSLISLAATFFMVLALAAPAVAQEPVDEQYDEGGGGSGEPVTATGVVEELEVSTFQYGTHSLTGSGYVMESQQVDLSEYNGQRVTVSGTLALEEGELENGPPLIEVTSVEPAEDSEGQSISGTVLQADGDSVLVEDASGGQYDFQVTASTSFADGLTYIPEEVPPREPNASDLAPGLEVEVTPAGAIAESFPAQGEAASIVFLSPWYDGADDEQPVEKALRGVITSADGGNITVSADPNLGVEDPGYCEQAINFSLTANTEILRQQGRDFLAASEDELGVGQSVEVAYTEVPGQPEIAICPPQREADSVVILDGPGGGNGGDGGNEDPGNGGSGGGNNGEDTGGNDGSVADRLGVSVLPDTGGALLPALGIGVALVAGGLFARRITR